MIEYAAKYASPGKVPSRHEDYALDLQPTETEESFVSVGTLSNIRTWYMTERTLCWTVSPTIHP